MQLPAVTYPRLSTGMVIYIPRGACLNLRFDATAGYPARAMSTDVGISVALGFVTIFMGYLGIHVSLHPVGESRRILRTYKVGFGVLAIIAVVLVWWQGARAADDRRQATQQHTEDLKAITALRNQIGQVEQSVGAIRLGVGKLDQLQFTPTPSRVTSRSRPGSLAFVSVICELNRDGDVASPQCTIALRNVSSELLHFHVNSARATIGDKSSRNIYVSRDAYVYAGQDNTYRLDPVRDVALATEPLQGQIVYDISYTVGSNSAKHRTAKKILLDLWWHEPLSGKSSVIAEVEE
jgi:hypothetical protein